MKKFIAGFGFMLAALFASAVSASAQEQPCQWNYSFVNGVATAKYCGNVAAAGSINTGVNGYVILSAYPNADAADADAVSKGFGVACDLPYTVTQNEVFNAPWFISQGCTLVHSSFTIEWKKSFWAASNQEIFGSTDTGLVTFDQSGPIYANWFSNYGTADDTVAVQSWINSGLASNGVPTGNTSLVATLSSGITLPPTLVYNFNGMQLVAGSSLTTGCSVTVDGTQVGYVGQQYAVINDLRLFKTLPRTGNSNANTSSTADGLCIGSGSGSSTSSSNTTINRLNVQGFHSQINVKGPNTYIDACNNCVISNGWFAGVEFSATVNTGENISFNGGVIANINNGTCTGTGILIDAGSSSGEFYLNNTSLDYSDIQINSTQGVLTATNAHFENNNNLAAIQTTKTTSRPNPTITLNGGQMGHGNGVALNSGVCPIETTNGRPVWIATTSSAYVNVFGTLVGQFSVGDLPSQVVAPTDLVSAPNSIRDYKLEPSMQTVNTFNSGPPIVLSYYKSKVYYNHTDTTHWTAAGSGATWTYDGTTFDAPDTGSMKVVGTTAANTSLTQYVPIIPGKEVIGRVYINVSAISAGQCQLNHSYFFDQGTTQISGTASSSSQFVNTAGASWTLAWFVEKAPAGAAFLQYVLSCSGFTGTANFSNLLVNQPD